MLLGMVILMIIIGAYTLALMTAGGPMAEMSIYGLNIEGIADPDPRLEELRDIIRDTQRRQRRDLPMLREMADNWSDSLIREIGLGGIKFAEEILAINADTWTDGREPAGFK